MKPLSSFDPDADSFLKRIDCKVNLDGSESAPKASPMHENTRCPTCHQKIPKKAPLNELRKIISVYKMAIGVPVGNKIWNSQFFPILIPTAKKMLEYLGDWRTASACVQDTVEAIREWNPAATISMQKIHSQHMVQWQMKNQENIEKQKGEIEII